MPAVKLNRQECAWVRELCGAHLSAGYDDGYAADQAALCEGVIARVDAALSEFSEGPAISVQRTVATV